MDAESAQLLALEVGGIGLYDFDPCRGRFSWSAAGKRQIGLPPEAEVDFDDFLASLHPDDRAHFDAELARALDPASGGRFRTEYRVIGPRDRIERWLEDWGCTFFDLDGRARRIVGATMEITARKQAEAALRESEERFRAAFEQAAVGIVYASADRHWLRVNRKFAHMLGYQPEELIGMPALELNHPDDREMLVAETERLRRGETDMCAMDKRFLDRQGRIVWVRLTVSAVRDPAGAFKYFVAISEDITARKHAEQRLEEAQAKLRLAVEISEVGFWEMSLPDRRVYFSPEYKRQLGYAGDELPDAYEEWVSRIHPGDRARVLAAQRDFQSGATASYEGEFRLRHKDGGYRWIASRGVLSVDSEGRPVKVTGTHLDITGRKDAELRIRHAAQHDALTSLAGRELIYELAEHQLASSRRSQGKLAFLFVDLDRFKPINDSHGHGAGDAVLRRVAGRLGECVRECDLLGRVGGDEFLVVLADVTNERQAAAVADKILGRLAEPYRIGALELAVTPSIGISLYPQDAADVETLIRYADTAMYEAKQRGRHKLHFFTPELDARAMEFIAIEDALKRGLGLGEFALHYQALVDICSGALVGVEALLRWRSGTLADVTPDRFIPVAETTGIIMPLGDWVLGEACRQHQLWRRQGLPPIPVAVNVSPVQFRQPDIRQRIEHALEVSGMPPGCLHLEITESTIMRNLDNAVDVLRALKSLGLKVSLDDFGTGYSSLNYLSRLPIDKLKVDKSFIQHLDDDKASRAITEAIFALARRLELDVVAEGVESTEALDFLRASHCGQAQGFLLCRPLAPEAFAAWYRARGEPASGLA